MKVYRRWYFFNWDNIELKRSSKIFFLFSNGIAGREWVKQRLLFTVKKTVGNAPSSNKCLHGIFRNSILSYLHMYELKFPRYFRKFNRRVWFRFRFHKLLSIGRLKFRSLWFVRAGLDRVLLVHAWSVADTPESRDKSETLVGDARIRAGQDRVSRPKGASQPRWASSPKPRWWAISSTFASSSETTWKALTREMKLFCSNRNYLSRFYETFPFLFHKADGFWSVSGGRRERASRDVATAGRRRLFIDRESHDLQLGSE